MSDDLRATAYHEAGHAVIRWAQRRAFRLVTIESGDDHAGRTEHYPVGDWFRPDLEVDGRVRHRIEDEIRGAWAGPLAEAIYLGHPDIADLAGNDRESIMDLAMYMSGSEEEAGAYIEWLRVSTLGQLRQPHVWRAVQVLATALLRQGTIRWREARDIIAAAVPEVWTYRRFGPANRPG
jgi:hypothetical protein